MCEETLYREITDRGEMGFAGGAELRGDSG